VHGGVEHSSWRGRDGRGGSRGGVAPARSRTRWILRRPASRGLRRRDDRAPRCVPGRSSNGGAIAIAFNWSLNRAIVHAEIRVEQRRDRTPTPVCAKRRQWWRKRRGSGDARRPKTTRGFGFAGRRGGCACKGHRCRVCAQGPGWEGRVAVLAGELRARRLAREGVNVLSEVQRPGRSRQLRWPRCLEPLPVQQAL
jgi:hypothetical protein